MADFFTAFAIVFAAEMGDKTQLFLIGLSSKFKLRSIMTGVAAAILVLNGAAVALGSLLGGKIDATAVKFVAGGAFLAFAYTSLLPKKEGEEKTRGGRAASIAVFISFFLAELGDKTQLTALTLSAEASSEGGGIPGAIVIFAACSAGLFAADMIGMAAGYFLSKKLPPRALPILSFILFTFFGVYSVYEAVRTVSGGDVKAVVISISALTAAFAALCAATLITLSRKDKKKNEKGNSAGNQPV